MKVWVESPSAVQGCSPSRQSEESPDVYINYFSLNIAYFGNSCSFITKRDVAIANSTARRRLR